MDTNRTLLKVFIASLALCATAAGAQTIYKQVDPEGRVIFSDQLNPAARVVASYEPGRPAIRPEREDPEPNAEPAAPVTGRSRNDVERAVTTYTSLNSPLALRVDATESARRARQEMHKDAAAGVLIVKPVPQEAREHESVAPDEGVSPYYVMWAATFLLLASGLLFVGWQTLRLILRGAFPRWQAGGA